MDPRPVVTAGLVAALAGFAAAAHAADGAEVELTASAISRAGAPALFGYDPARRTCSPRATPRIRSGCTAITRTSSSRASASTAAERA